MVNEIKGQIVGEMSWEFLFQKSGNMSGGIAKNGFKERVKEDSSLRPFGKF